MPEEGTSTARTEPQEPGTNEQQISVNKSNIKVPVDIQDALEIKEELYAADGTAAQNITMDKRGYGFVQALAKSTAAKLHTYTLEYSFDNINWYNQYTSGAPELSTNQTLSSTARYWRWSSDAVAGAHTLDLILGATQSS
jgi:hypothetical protein